MGSNQQPPRDSPLAAIAPIRPRTNWTNRTSVHESPAHKRTDWTRTLKSVRSVRVGGDVVLLLIDDHPQIVDPVDEPGSN
jgi:hypothetical protein